MFRHAARSDPPAHDEERNLLGSSTRIYRTKTMYIRTEYIHAGTVVLVTGIVCVQYVRIIRPVGIYIYTGTYSEYKINQVGGISCIS